MRHSHSLAPVPLRRALLPAAAALLLATGAAPARAAAQDPQPANWLQLSVTRDTAPSDGTRATLLLCGPPQGHRRAAEACDQLNAVNGDLAALPAAQDTVCTLVYAPVTAHASGQWNGRAVAYSQTFSNACEMAARTGAVFALDDTAADAPGA
ncbi:SSI family serine proteinase inhibitor [Streptomyces sp. DSM 15324]|uniref:SSI family serine proteinase inhibitor n=1 Tax=Streptomyces sp. DSM 15324 TaxID=1739111 RepID=UPI00074862E2|nr:SSI family serine proteinase inhibitor [Streptomyces sp. DSM 15324]KUO12747.1 serine protease [Streptomyces sp. DSM 15324]